MPSLCNVIKSVCVENTGKKPIDTDISIVNKRRFENDETNSKEYFGSYENLAKGILENARKQKDEMMLKAYNECSKMESDANEKIKKEYNKAAEKGYKDGFEKAYKEYYEKNIKKAEEDSKVMIKNAENTIQAAKDEYARYLNEKEPEIKDLIFKIAESVLKREVKDKDALNEMLFDALSKEKSKGKFIIRCSKCYEEGIKSNIENWESKLALKNDIFIITDEQIQQGTALIEKEDGKTIISIDDAAQKIKEILFETD